MVIRRVSLTSAVASLLVSPLVTAAALCPPRDGPTVFKHPGMLHTAEDLDRMKTSVAAGLEPWKTGYEKLTNNWHSSLTYAQSPVETVVRGKNETNSTENYSLLYNDVAAAYAHALRWHISGDEAHADKAVEILNDWAATLKYIDGSSDRFLAAGIYGYQLANAGELLREYDNWACEDFYAFVDLMVTLFYPMNHDFLVRHNNYVIDHYWANWDLANMASMISIGILADRQDIFDEAVEYFKHGEGNGAIEKAVWILYPDGTGQVQESGRDQPHATLAIAELALFCEMAYNQGEDLFAYDNNRVLAGAEYVAKYNLGYDVEYTTYVNSEVNQTVISPTGRGFIRPQWEHLYNHYVVKKKLRAPYIEEFAANVRPEGGGGNYGPNSNGYDLLGYGTLTYTLKESPVTTSDPPTATPTDEPTEEPSEKPTEEPTQEPTLEPTNEPTEKPTQEPVTPLPAPSPEPVETPVPSSEPSPETPAPTSATSESPGAGAGETPAPTASQCTA